MKTEQKIQIDENLWKLANQKISNLNEFIETQLKIETGLLNTKETELIRKITEHQTMIAELTSELMKEQKQNLEDQENTQLFDEVMITINRIHDNLGAIGKNQIEQISKRGNVPFLSLLNHCNKLGLNIVNFNEVPKER